MMFEEPARVRLALQDADVHDGDRDVGPSRKTAMTNSVKRIFARRSGTRNALRNAFSTVT